MPSPATETILIPSLARTTVQGLTWIRYCSRIWARSKQTLCPTTNCSCQSRWVELLTLAEASRGMRSAGDSWLVQE
jgi:hypothetical protein